MTAREMFSEWTDFDIAEYYVACLIGLCEYDETGATFRDSKSVYNTSNGVGNMLYRILKDLTEGGVLMFDSDLGQYKFNDSFFFTSE